MEAVQTLSTEAFTQAPTRAPAGALAGTWAGGASQHVEGERGTPHVPTLGCGIIKPGTTKHSTNFFQYRFCTPEWRTVRRGHSPRIHGGPPPQPAIYRHLRRVHVLLYKSTQKAITGILRTVFRARVTGLENFPANGPVIVASNHLSFLDSIIISAMMPRRVAFLAKAEYVNTPGPRGKMMKAFFEAVDIIPVNRSDRSESLKALDIALEKLQEGKVFGIYPEGTRSRDGYLYRGKIGVAWLAHMTGAPVVPVGLIGTDRLQKPGSNMIYPRRFTIRVGKPLYFEKIGETMTGKQRRVTTDTIMNEIAQLSGQARKHEYNVSPSAARDAG